MNYGRPQVKVGDYIRDREENRNWTVAAVLKDGSVITDGSDCKWLQSGDFELKNSCDKSKHERDLRRFAYAAPDYMRRDDPRALCNQRKIENRVSTTYDARDLLKNKFESFLDTIIESIVSSAESGNIHSFADVTEIIEDHIDRSGYVSFKNRLVEAIYVSLDDIYALSKKERDFLERIARRFINNRLAERFRNKDGPQIDLDKPKTIHPFLKHINGED